MIFRETSPHKSGKRAFVQIFLEGMSQINKILTLYRDVSYEQTSNRASIPPSMVKARDFSKSITNYCKVKAYKLKEM